MTDMQGNSVRQGELIRTKKEALNDSGCRRHLCWGMDFDTRSAILAMEIEEEWREEIKDLWRENKEKVRKALVAEFGEQSIDKKIERFVELDSKPFSILSYHNGFFHQVRQSYVLGAYYPALVGACALGERILNHLIIDLRHFFSATPEYRKVHRKKSFDNWDTPIDVLLAWGVLLPDVAEKFRDLKVIRHRSIHFNVETYATLKDDSLSAVLKLREIINLQFGVFGHQPWFIKGTKGHQFIAKEWEAHPFIQTYFFQTCPFVGPYFSMEHSSHGWKFFDRRSYGEDKWSDEEFAKTFNDRKPEMLARKAECQ